MLFLLVGRHSLKLAQRSSRVILPALAALFGLGETLILWGLWFKVDHSVCAYYARHAVKQMEKLEINRFLGLVSPIL